MEANVTELAQIVETLRQEISLLRGNVTSSALSASRVAGQLDALGTDMDSMWLMLGAILVVCETAVPSTVVRWSTVVLADHSSSILYVQLFGLSCVALSRNRPVIYSQLARWPSG